MPGLDHLPQPVRRHVGVDLGGPNVGVTQQGLHHAQVRAALQQMGRKGMPQHMRADPRRVDAGLRRRLIQHLAEAARREAAGLTP